MARSKKKQSRSLDQILSRKKIRHKKRRRRPSSFWQRWEQLDCDIVYVMNAYGYEFLQISLGVVFIWFGILKPFGLSPASALVAQTVYWVDPAWFIPFLGWWEVLIGACLLYRPLIRAGIFLMALQMIGTFLPLILLPHVVYGGSILQLTLPGQYIVKNLVLIGAAMVIGSRVRDKTCKLL